jgi:hypothetical protein
VADALAVMMAPFGAADLVAAVVVPAVVAAVVVPAAIVAPIMAIVAMVSRLSGAGEAECRQGKGCGESDFAHFHHRSFQAPQRVEP